MNCESNEKSNVKEYYAVYSKILGSGKHVLCAINDLILQI